MATASSTVKRRRRRDDEHVTLVSVTTSKVTSREHDADAAASPFVDRRLFVGESSLSQQRPGQRRRRPAATDGNDVAAVGRSLPSDGPNDAVGRRGDDRRDCGGRGGDDRRASHCCRAGADEGIRRGEGYRTTTMATVALPQRRSRSRKTRRVPAAVVALSLALALFVLAASSSVVDAAASSSRHTPSTASAASRAKASTKKMTTTARRDGRDRRPGLRRPSALSVDRELQRVRREDIDDDPQGRRSRSKNEEAIAASVAVAPVSSCHGNDEREESPSTPRPTETGLATSSSLSVATTRGGGAPTAAAPSATTDPRLLLLIRLLFLTYYASLGSLLPYLPVYYHSLGHGGSAIGLLGAVKPLTTFLVAPLWGVLSDRKSGASSGDGEEDEGAARRRQRLHRMRVLQFAFLTGLAGQLSVVLKDNVTYLMTAVFVAALFNAPVKSLLDSAVMDMLSDEEKSNYGKLRLWGQLGFGLGSSGVGVLLSRVKTAAGDGDGGIGEGASDAAGLLGSLARRVREAVRGLSGYELAFLAHGLLSAPAFLCMKGFQRFDNDNGGSGGNTARRDGRARKGGDDVTKRKETRGKSTKAKGEGGVRGGGSASHILHGLRLLLRNDDALLFFFLVFVVGTSSGIIENFAYVRIREVGGTGKDMGLSRLVSSAAGAPMFWFSGPLTEALGADRVLVLSLLSYVARFFIYALMKRPVHGLPAEALRGVTFAAFWSTGTVYAHRISPPGMGATMLMFLNAMYGGLGQSLGAIIGGKLQSRFGTVRAFLYSGTFDLCFVAVVVTYLSWRGSSGFRDPRPMGEKDGEEEDEEMEM